MKRAVILHGVSGDPNHNWFPWLKKELASHGYKIFAPQLPGSDTPNRHIYNDFLFGSGWDFSDNLVVGHSAGAVSILNLLADARCPNIKTAVLVSPWTNTAKANLDHDGLTRERFKDLIPAEGFDLAPIKQRCDNFIFIHGEGDPFCPIEQTEELARQLGGDLIVIPGGKHLNQTAGYYELPQLVEALKAHNLL